MRAFLRQTLIASLATMTAVSPAWALVTLGHGRLVGSAGAKVEYDSNIFVSNPEVNPRTGARRAAVDVADYVATATAELRYVRDSGVVKFDAGAGVNAVGFADHSDQNTADPYVDARLGYAPSDKTDVRLAVGYRRNSVANEQLNTRTESNDLTFDGMVQHLPSEKLGFRFTGGYQKNDYSTPASAPAGFGYSDIETYSVGAHLVHAYSQKLKLLGGVTWSDWSSSAKNTADSVDTGDLRYSVAAEGELSPKVTGEISAGYVTREITGDARTGLNRDVGALYLASRVSWQAAEKTILSVTAGQNLSLSAANQSVRALNLGVALNHAFSEKLVLDAGIGAERANYLGSTAVGSRRDEAYSVRARLSYTLSDAAAADLSTSYRESFSTNALSDYDRFTLGAGITVRF